MSIFGAITQNVKVAAGNSSTVNLAAGATWTGTPVSTLGVNGLQWNLNTDQNCSVYSEEGDGSHAGIGTLETAGTTTLLGTDTKFLREFVVGDTISVEGETDRIVATIVSDVELTVTVAFSTTASLLTFTHYQWDISYKFNYKASADGRGEGETSQATSSYWRLRIVNEGASATTYFRAIGVLCPIAFPLPSALSSTRRLKVENLNHNVAIPAGLIDGYSSVNKFGHNDNVAAGSTEDIWDGGGTYVFPATALMTKLSQTADQVALRGANIEVQGLDANWVLVTQTKALDASNTETPVTLTTPLIRAFRMRVLANVVITSSVRLHNDAESVDYAIMQTGNNQTLMAIYTVPNGKTAYVTQWRATVTDVSAAGSPTSNPIRMWARDNANTYAPQLKDLQGLVIGSLNVTYEPHNKFTQKTDIWFSASPVTKAANVAVGFDLILIDNTLIDN